ncbi:MAG: GNAT family N-acetyltransferase [Candidatus Korarchaeum sp.]
MRIAKFNPSFLEDIVRIHCPKWRTMSLSMRLRDCGYWGDPRVLSWYVENLLSVGGRIVVALKDEEVVGEAEVVPERFRSPVGEHAYLQMVWVREEERRAGVGRKLVDECCEIAREMGFNALDTIPNDEAIAFFETLGFSEIESQVLMEAQPRPAPEQPKVEELGRKEFPVAAQMIAGQTRPSALLWELLWGREEVGLPPPKVLKVRVGLWEFIMGLFKPVFEDNYLYVLIWGPEKSGLGQIFDSAEMALTVAYEMGVTRLRTQTWCKYRAAFEAAGFEPMKRVKWMRKLLK